MHDFSIIIQGPQAPNSHSIKMIDNYKRFGKIIVSHWSKDRLKLTDKDINIVHQILPRTENVANRQNIYYQCVSTLNGLLLCDTEFAIKIRSDEKYENIKPILEKIKEYPDKLITTNIYFRKFNYHPMHISDHIIGSTTDNMVGTFKTLKHWLETDEKCSNLMPEQLIYLSYLKYKNIKYNENLKDIDNKKIMQDTVDIVPVSRLGNFIWGDSYGENKKYNDKRHHGHMETMEDL